MAGRAAGSRMVALGSLSSLRYFGRLAGVGGFFEAYPLALRHHAATKGIGRSLGTQTVPLVAAAATGERKRGTEAALGFRPSENHPHIRHLGKEEGPNVTSVPGHSDWVTCVEWSPDGRSIASASKDMIVKVWDAGTKEEVGIGRGHSGTIRSVAWSPDGETVASGSGDRTVRLWSKSGEHKGTLRGHSDYVGCVAYSPDAATLASASWDGTVKLWDLSGGAPAERGTLGGHSGRVVSVAFSPDSRTLFTASCDGTVKRWDLSGETPAEGGTLAGSEGRVVSVAYSPDGGTVASARWDGTVRLWDAESMEAKGQLVGHSNVVSSVAYSPDSKALASASYDGTVRLWDLSGGTLVERAALRGHSEDNKGCVCFQHLKGSLSDNGDASSVADESNVFPNPRCREKGHWGFVFGVDWSPDGRRLVSGGQDKTLKIWEL